MAKFVPQAELPVSEQAAIRREKLAALRAEGRDPFVRPSLISMPTPLPSRPITKATKARSLRWQAA